jgi:capsule polysaccharide export protein KpsE/RkpR
MLAALSGRMMPGNLGALAGSFLGIRNSSEIFAELLQSRSVRERIVDRFDLQKLYWNRYKQDSIKKLGKRTDVTEDRKTGIITLVVTDTDRRRARDMAQAYLDELNTLVARVNTSAASRERQFIEQRLIGVKVDLNEAETQLSNFSTKNATLDVKEQTKAMVDATAKLEGELIVARSELSSLDQIYGPENVRVRASRARVAQLDQEMNQATGYGKGAASSDAPPYPSLRAIPALAVQWADLYRRVKTQETIFELLTQEYEMARIEEAKSTANIGVIDAPSWPERKSFPPRLIIMLAGMLLSAAGCFVLVVRRAEWSALAEHDPRKQLFSGMIFDLKRDHPSWFVLRRTPKNGHQL